MATNLDIAQNFDELAYGSTDTNTSNHTSAVLIYLKPSSNQKVILNSIHFTAKWTTVWNTTATTTEIKIAGGQVYVFETSLTPDALTAIPSLYSAGTTVSRDTLEPKGIKLRYIYHYNNYNMIPLTDLNIKSATNKALVVLVNCPNLSANDTGNPVTLNISAVAFGTFEEQNADLKPVTYKH